MEDWDVPDPADKTVSQVRVIRDEVEHRVRDLIENRLDAIRSDRTAHQTRLERLLPGLIDEFESERTPAEIRACADVILAEYDDAPVRSFTMTLANRRARECLRADVCEPLTAA